VAVTPKKIPAPADPKRYDEAVDAFRKRVPISNDDYDLLDEVARQRAFTVADVTQADLIADTFDALDRAIESGSTFEDFQDAIGDRLFDSWGKPDAARLETVFRTNVAQAYNDGRWEQITDPDVIEAFPYWRMDGIADAAQTDICIKVDQTIRPASDPWWSTHKPPLHFNCRTIVTPIDEDTAREAGIDVRAPRSTPNAPTRAPGFGLAPVDQDPVSPWEPDLSDYPAPIAKELDRRLRAR